jgi:transposase-like protein
MQIKLHKQAKTTPFTRKYIQESSKSTAELAKELNVCTKTILKWKRRDSVNDLSHTRHNLRITLSALEEEIIKALKLDFYLSLDDITYVMNECVRETIKRGAVYRSLRREGINKKINPNEGDEPNKKKYGKFEDEDNSQIGFIHMDVKFIHRSRKIATDEEWEKDRGRLKELNNKINRKVKARTKGGEGKYYYLYVAIDRATRHVFVRLKEQNNSKTSTEFLKEFQEYFPHPIRVLLTDNGPEFTNRSGFQPKNGRKKDLDHPFNKLCHDLKIDRRHTKPRKPQTNGMVERFNRRISEECIKNRSRELYGFENIKKYLYNFVNNYNNTKLRVLNYQTPISLLKEDIDHKEHNNAGRVTNFNINIEDLA